jgi:hypothetical protein
MAEIYVRTYETESGLEVRGSGLRTGSAQIAADRAIEMIGLYPPPNHITKIRFSGSFVDPAFADLTQLVQQHGLHLENSDG